jgi:hypothetical protein
VIEQPIIKSIGLLLAISVGVFIGTYEIAEFFLKESEFRKFWLKVWLVISGKIGVALWLLLLFWG